MDSTNKAKKIVIATFFVSPVLVVIVDILMQFAINNRRSYPNLLGFSSTVGLLLSLSAFIFAIVARKKFQSGTLKWIRVLNLITIIVSPLAFLGFLWPCDC